MTTQDLITLFSKGSNTFILSEKQQNWLASIAKKDGLYQDTGFGQGIINMPDLRRYKITEGKRFASGGSYVGTRSTGTWKVQLCYMVQYSDTGITEFRDCYTLDTIKREGKHKFNII